MENITGAQPCPICENEELFFVRLDATSYTASGAVLCQKCGYTKVLSWYKAKKNTDVPRWRDIHDFNGSEFRNSHEEGQSVTLLSGGFPCQPHSLSGKREASADERDLWPEYRRVISEIKPKWILAENVPGLRTSESGYFFRNILRDLSELGFDAGWGSVRASWIGAPHRRERIFIVAHAHSERRKCLEEGQENRCYEVDTKSFESETWETAWAKTSNLLLDGAGILASGSGISNRNDDGLPTGVDRLTALGNAVVPQQVYPIVKAIAEKELNLERRMKAE